MHRPSSVMRVPARTGTLLITLLALVAASLVMLTATSARAAETLLSQGKTATASSREGDGFPASAAVDGDLTGTRWASEWRDPQWIQVDLGERTAFQHIQLDWESAYAKAYTIQVSDDGQSWRTVHEVTDGNGGIDDFDVSDSARYVRLHATERGTGYGYSLHEFGIYG